MTEVTRMRWLVFQQKSAARIILSGPQIFADKSVDKSVDEHVDKHVEEQLTEPHRPSSESGSSQDPRRRRDGEDCPDRSVHLLSMRRVK